MNLIIKDVLNSPIKRCISTDSYFPIGLMIKLFKLRDGKENHIFFPDFLYKSINTEFIPGQYIFCDIGVIDFFIKQKKAFVTQNFKELILLDLIYCIKLQVKELILNKKLTIECAYPKDKFNISYIDDNQNENLLKSPNRTTLLYKREKGNSTYCLNSKDCLLIVDYPSISELSNFLLFVIETLNNIVSNNRANGQIKLSDNKLSVLNNNSKKFAEEESYNLYFDSNTDNQNYFPELSHITQQLHTIQSNSIDNPLILILEKSNDSIAFLSNLLKLNKLLYNKYI